MPETKVRTNKAKEIAKKIISMAREDTGCSIQHGDCPCNTCFHSWAENTVGLDERLAHALWLIVLWGRGDYTPTDLVDAVKEL